MKIINGKGPLRKGELDRPRRRWEDNIKMYVREVGWQGKDWKDLA
jgi:hypothetical protein